MRHVERGHRDHGVAHADEAASEPGRTTNVRDAAARDGGAPYTTATMTGDRVPWSSDRPEAAPRIDLTPKLSSGLAPAPAVEPLGPGLTEVKKLYAPYAPGDGVGDPGLIADVARIVETHPAEQAAIFAYIEARDGADAGRAVLAAVDKDKHKKKGITLQEGGLDLGNPLLPRLGVPVWAGGVSQEADNPEERRIAELKRNDKRRSVAKRDKPHNPIVDGLNRLRNGPEAESEDESRNGQKLIDAIDLDRDRKRDGGTPDAGTPDAGSPLQVRKRLDD